MTWTRRAGRGLAPPPGGPRILPGVERYEPDAIEARWQAVWAAERAFEPPNPADPAADDRHTLRPRWSARLLRGRRPAWWL